MDTSKTAAMDIEHLKLIVDIIKSLAWPAIVFWLVFLFKKRIDDTFSVLTQRMSGVKLKILGSEIEISKFVDDTTKEINQAISELEHILPKGKSSRFLAYQAYQTTEEAAYHAHTIETFEKIGVNNLAPEIWNAVGHYYFTLDKAKSRMYYEKAIKAKPDDVDAHTNLAFWHLYHDDIHAAKQECGIAISFIGAEASIHPWTYVCLATIYERLGEKTNLIGAIQKAKIMFQAHIDEDYTNFSAHCGLGWCWMKGEPDNDQAIEHEKTALEIKPDFLVARYNLACAYARKGMADEAIAELRHMLKQSIQSIQFFKIEGDADFKPIATNDQFLSFMKNIGTSYQC